MLNTLAALVDLGRQHEAAVAEAPRSMRHAALVQADAEMVAFLADGECLPPSEMRQLATVMRLMARVRANRSNDYDAEDAWLEASEAFAQAAKKVAKAIGAEAAEQPLSRSQQLAMFGTSVMEVAA